MQKAGLRENRPDSLNAGTSLACNSDPVTSFIAAENYEKKGRRRTDKMKVLACVQDRKGCTAVELATRFGFNRFMVSRRLPDLRIEGLVQHCPYCHEQVSICWPDCKYAMRRPCMVVGSQMMVWYPTERLF